MQKKKRNEWPQSSFPPCARQLPHAPRAAGGVEAVWRTPPPPMKGGMKPPATTPPGRVSVAGRRCAAAALGAAPPPPAAPFSRTVVHCTPCEHVAGRVNQEG
jgi:hypothetical protein